MVTICTTEFGPQSVFMCFVWISEKTAIISLYSTNCLVFVTEMECVYCAVRTGYLCIIQFYLDPRSVHVTFVVYRLVLWQVFLPVLQFSPVTTVPQSLLPTDQPWEPSIKYCFLWNLGGTESKSIHLTFKRSIAFTLVRTPWYYIL